MKKLMFAVVAAVAASVYAESKEGIDQGVYALTFTEKSVASDYVYETVKVPSASELAKNPEEWYWNETAEAAKEVGEEYAEWLLIEYPEGATVKLITTKKGSYKCEETGKKKTGYTFIITFNVPKVDPATEEPILKGKTVSSTLNGLYVSGYGEEKDGAYIWDKTIKHPVYKKICALKMEDFELEPVFAGSIVSAGWEWTDLFTADALKGFGIGTTAKNSDKEDTEFPKVVKTLAGGFAGDACYGTWKFQKDAAATKLAAKGKTLQQILDSKKVELFEELPDEDDAE